MTVFETPRLRATEVTEDDITELLEVHHSNQAYLDLTEGSGGAAGTYDRGLVMIHADHHRRGLAAETIGGLAEHGRAAGWTRLREGVIDGNKAGMALALGVGMREVERKTHRIAAGDCELAVMELGLRAQSAAR